MASGVEELLDMLFDTGHFFDDGGAEIGILFAGRQKHGLQLGVQLAIDDRHLNLLFKIGHRPQALHHHMGPPALGVSGQQITGKIHLYIGKPGGGFFSPDGLPL